MSGQCSPFIPEHRLVEKEHRQEIDSWASFLLLQILKRFQWRITSKFIRLYQPNLVGMRGISVSKMKKVGLVFYTLPYSL